MGRYPLVVVLAAAVMVGPGACRKPSVSHSGSGDALGDGAGDAGPADGLDTTAPVAVVSGSPTVLTGVQLELDGSGSHDQAATTLSYQWTLTTRPAGSAADVVDAQAAVALLTPDVSGTYVVSLVVNDGRNDSAPAAHTVLAKPVAVAGDLDGGLAPLVSQALRDLGLDARDVGNLIESHALSMDDGYAMWTEHDPVLGTWQVYALELATSTRLTIGSPTEVYPNPQLSGGLIARQNDAGAWVGYDLAARQALTYPVGDLFTVSGGWAAWVDRAGYGSVVLRSLTTGTQTTVRTAEGTIAYLRFDGVRLAWKELWTSGVYTYDVGSTTLTHLRTTGDNVGLLAMRDGIVTWADDTEVWAWSAAGGSAFLVDDSNFYPVRSLDTAQGYVVWGVAATELSMTTNIMVYDTSDGTTLPVLPDLGYRLGFLIADGRVLWSEFRDSVDVMAFDLATKTATALVESEFQEYLLGADGARFCWYVPYTGMVGPILCRDAPSGASVAITSAAYYPSSLAIGDADVVWQDRRNGFSESRLWSGVATGEQVLNAACSPTQLAESFGAFVIADLMPASAEGAVIAKVDAAGLSTLGLGQRPANQSGGGCGCGCGATTGAPPTESDNSAGSLGNAIAPAVEVHRTLRDGGAMTATADGTALDLFDGVEVSRLIALEPDLIGNQGLEGYVLASGETPPAEWTVLATHATATPLAGDGAIVAFRTAAGTRVLLDGTYFSNGDSGWDAARLQLLLNEMTYLAP